MRTYKSAFTIVELLIVIVVIAILASVSIVAFNGVQERAKNSSRLNELVTWQKGYEIYKATYGSYPKASPDVINDYGFCLGTGYPGETNTSTGAGGRCHDNNALVNIPLNTEIKKVMNLPNGIRVPTKSGALGVYADYWSYVSGGVSYYANTIELVQIFDGSANCPSPTYQKYAYTSGSTVISRMCAVKLTE